MFRIRILPDWLCQYCNKGKNNARYCPGQGLASKDVVKGEYETHDLDFSFCANKLHQEPKKILEN